MDNFSMRSAIERLKKQISTTGTIIDVGASNGSWSRLAMEFFAESEYFLIEAKKEHEKELIILKDEKNIIYEIAAAGDFEGEVFFKETPDLFGGWASHDSDEKKTRVVPMITIDESIKKYELKPPYLIKLDTHGFEVPILEGAENTLKETNALIIEVYSFKINKDCLTFPDMCKYLEEKGFRCIGIADPLNRMYDGVLWQMDLIFVKSNHSVFDYNKYSHITENENQAQDSEIEKHAIYTYGTELIFGIEANHSYKLTGFSIPEKELMWIDGVQGIMVMPISKTNNNLQLQIKGFTHGLQEMSLSINGKQIEHWITSGEVNQKILIPKELLKENMIEIKIDVPTAYSPISAKESEENRSLGLALQSLILDEL